MPEGSAEAKSLTGLLQRVDSYVDNETIPWLKESGKPFSLVVFPFSNECYDPFIPEGLNQL